MSDRELFVVIKREVPGCFSDGRVLPPGMVPLPHNFGRPPSGWQAEEDAKKRFAELGAI